MYCTYYILVLMFNIEFLLVTLLFAVSISSSDNCFSFVNAFVIFFAFPLLSFAIYFVFAIYFAFSFSYKK